MARVPRFFVSARLLPHFVAHCRNPDSTSRGFRFLVTRRVRVAALLGLVCWPTLASADAITLVFDRRGAIVITPPLERLEEFGGDVIAVTETSSGVSAFATVTSNISDLHHISGNGVVSVESTVAGDFSPGFAAATSQFVIGFNLDGVYDYSFHGSWTGSPDAIGFAELSTGGFGGRFFSQVVRGSRGFENSRRLVSGEYALFVGNNVGASAFSSPTLLNSSFEFTFDLQPAATPEPGSMVLLGSGLVGLVGFMRRRTGRFRT